MLFGVVFGSRGLRPFSRKCSNRLPTADPPTKNEALEMCVSGKRRTLTRNFRNSYPLCCLKVSFFEKKCNIILLNYLVPIISNHEEVLQKKRYPISLFFAILLSSPRIRSCSDCAIGLNQDHHDYWIWDLQCAALPCGCQAWHLVPQNARQETMRLRGGNELEWMN